MIPEPVMAARELEESVVPIAEAAGIPVGEARDELRRRLGAQGQLQDVECPECKGAGRACPTCSGRGQVIAPGPGRRSIGVARALEADAKAGRWRGPGKGR